MKACFQPLSSRKGRLSANSSFPFFPFMAKRIPPFLSKEPPIEDNRSRDPKARETTKSNSALLSLSCSFGPFSRRTSIPVSPNTRITFFKKKTFFCTDSKRKTFMSARTIFKGIPGKPAPEPKSTREAPKQNPYPAIPLRRERVCIVEHNAESRCIDRNSGDRQPSQNNGEPGSAE